MKDFLQFVALISLVMALSVAIPVLGFVLGVGMGIWFLWMAFKEHRDGQG